MRKKITLILLLITISLSAQNTVGTISNSANSFVGYTLISPLNSTSTYLINNCGEIVNQWSSNYTPGASVYLLENGNLLRTGKINNPNFTFGGIGGIIQMYDWDNNLLWNYAYSNTNETQHHDIYPMPNGNVLILAVDRMTQAEAIAAGRNPAKITEGEIFNEKIIEVQPTGSNTGTVVWQWDIKDHLIQDFDSSKNNFGNVANNPNKLDFNYTNGNPGDANWLHINSIQYNSQLDQIVMSSRLLGEIYIIDHSTSTSQAMGSTGGIYGKGGDFLYRWGNAEAYRKGSAADQKLEGQHYPHWIEQGLQDEGKIMIFNNGTDRGYSSVDIINPLQTSPGVYDYNSTTGFSPLNTEYSYTAPTNTDFYSSIVSSGQRLPNGNTLICDGDSGYLFEIDSNDNIVWEYVNPEGISGPVAQGQEALLNILFRGIKFAPDYAAFNGRTLTPGSTIESNPDLSNCNALSVDDFALTEEVLIYPNPTSNYINISITDYTYSIYDVSSKKIDSGENKKRIDLTHLDSGIYFIMISKEGTRITKKIIKT